MSAAPRRRLSAIAPKTPRTAERNADEIGRPLDEAMARFQQALPGYGLKLLLPPALPGFGTRVSVSAWQRGNESARVHTAASAQKAVQLLLDCETAADRERTLRHRCARCHGVGWYVTPGGTNAICEHSSAAGAQIPTVESHSK